MNIGKPVVGLAEIEAARRVLAGHVLRTPMLPAPRLSALTGAQVFVKYENLQVTNSFKERGARVKLASLSEAERRRGVIAMSAGNHAQAVAYHASLLGIAATIVMPVTTPFVKVAATKAYGACVLLDGEGVSEEVIGTLLREHVDPEVPTVLYPSIHLNDNKQPKVFLDIVSEVAEHMPLQMEARLGQRDLASVLAMKMSSPTWAQVGPLFGEREEYWEALARTTAFLATAKDEAYGFEYMEALLAGVVGVLPRAKWSSDIVPETYPYLYDNSRHAVALLEEVLTDPKAARAKIDESAGGPISEWILGHHRRSGGNEAIANQISDWFPEISAD